MATPDGALHVAFNGEIYNFRELRSHLEARGHAFRTRSDTEVLLHGYREWGRHLASHLNGMFAFVVWDDAGHRLHAARDRAGQKPFFFAPVDGGIAFSSEIGPLLGLVDDEVARLDPVALAAYLSLGYVPAPRTMHRGIRALEPGGWLEVGPEGRASGTYWRYPGDRAPDAPTPGAAGVTGDPVAGIRHHVTEAVRRRLVSDVPVGAFLSGGIDSAVVVALMAEAGASPPSTFSVGFDGHPDFDETGAARKVADHFGTRHHRIAIGPEVIDDLDHIVRHLGEPFADSSALPTYVLSRFARRRVTVALSGDGADEIFAGYHRFRAAVVAEGLPPALSSIARGIGPLLPDGGDFRGPARRLRRFAAGASLPPAERDLAWMPYFGADPSGLLRPGLVGAADPAAAYLREMYAGYDDLTPLGRTLAVNFRSYLPGDLLVKVDRMSMAHGLEVRSPFLDPDLVAFAAGLPDAYKIHRGVLKRGLRDAFGDILPAGVLDLPKRGFAVPLAAWLRTAWRPAVEERLLASDARCGEWLARDRVREIVAEHLDGRADHAHRVWSLLVFETWLHLRSP